MEIKLDYQGYVNTIIYCCHERVEAGTHIPILYLGSTTLTRQSEGRYFSSRCSAFMPDALGRDTYSTLR